MKSSEKYALEIQSIRQMIENLKAGQVYEIQNTPGVPRVSTVGGKLEEKFDVLIRKLDQEAPGDIEIAAHILEN